MSSSSSCSWEVLGEYSKTFFQFNSIMINKQQTHCMVTKRERSFMVHTKSHDSHNKDEKVQLPE